MADLVYVITIVAFVILRILRIISQRRKKSAGSQLHLRLTGFFTLMALLPTIGVAVFATFTVNMGLEAWFSDRVQSVISASRSAAEAYEAEQREALIEDIADLANELGFFRKGRNGTDLSEFRNHLAKLQQEMQRGMKEAFVIDDKGKIKSIGKSTKVSDVSKSVEKIDLKDKKAVSKLFSDYTFDGIIHFAAHKSVNESVNYPEKYFSNNVVKIINSLWDEFNKFDLLSEFE